MDTRRHSHSGTVPAEITSGDEQHLAAAISQSGDEPREKGTGYTTAIKMDAPSSYPGGKSGAGVYQTLINLIPPHHTYIETHLGGGAIMRHKRPAAVNIGIDLDPEVISRWRAPGYTFINGDASSFLRRYPFSGKEFVYADPPYLMETRKGGRLYNFEYTTEQHVELLAILKQLPCMVMISGYWSELYAKHLAGWNTLSFRAQTRRGTSIEWVWFNYPEPTELHDYAFLGKTYRERERIKRQRQRWINRLSRLPVIERNALLIAMIAAAPDPATQNPTVPPGCIAKSNCACSHRQK